MESKISRRNFVAGMAGLGALATASIAGCKQPQVSDGKGQTPAGASVYPQFDIPGRPSMAEFEASAAIAEPITAWDAEESYDVVVVGAGVGGVPCAIRVAENGMKVCLLQKEGQPVGQGTGMCKLDLSVTTDAAAARMLHAIYEYTDYQSEIKLNRVWIRNSFNAVNWYAEKCTEAGLEFSSSPMGTFAFEEGVAQTTSLNFNGGMNTPTVGLGQFFAEKVNAHWNTPGVQLIVEDGKVVGVFGKDETGKIIRFNAAKGVILATGDYQNNDAMVEKYVPDALLFEKKQFNKTGDGHLMGLMAGAKMQNINHTKMVHAKNWGANVTTFRNSPFMAVDLNGERFTPEDIAMYYRCNTVRSTPNNVWISILDAHFMEQAQEWGADTARQMSDAEALDKLGEAGGVYKADTLEALAGKIGVPADALVASVKRYNELVEKGVDEDFGKPAKYLAPIKDAPFYGLHREFAVSAITSGLEINEHAQVLNAQRKPIDGLFAIGNCSGPFYGSIDYPVEVAGLSVSRCITFGYVVADYIASL